MKRTGLKTGHYNREKQDAGLPDADQRRRGKRQPSGPPVKATWTQKARPKIRGPRKGRGKKARRYKSKKTMS